ncbi:MAG: cation:proton antiporter [Candidatus Hydrogenedentota bacterium]
MDTIRELLGIHAAGEMTPLLVLCLILIAGLGGGWVAKRLHIPTVTGNIIAGVLIGPACLDLFAGMDVKYALAPLSTFAMALITVAVGSQLSYQRLHNAWRRVLAIGVAEVVVALVFSTLAVRLLGAGWPTALMLGCIATNSSPATIVAIVRETRSKGTYVKTLLATVGIDNMLCILLFAFARMLLVDYDAGPGMGFLVPVLHTLYQVAGSVALGLGLGFLTERFVHQAHMHDFSTVFVMILLAVGLSNYFGVSPLLTSLMYGIYLGNASEEAQRQTRALEPLEMLLFIAFFTVAGASLHLDSVAAAGVICVAYVAARFSGKAIGAALGGIASRTSRRIWINTGFGLMPQAGVAIGLVVLLSGDTRLDPGLREMVTTVVLAAVAIAEIFGPFLVRLGLRRANELNKDRRRLMEFLQEEYITTDLTAQDKWEAIRKLTDFYIRTHRTKPEDRQQLYNSIIDREKDFTTGIGLGAAIPHGRIEKGQGIRGVLAICREGVDWDAPDGEPVKLIMLLVTPRGYEKEHLEVMASLASMISDEMLRTRLVAAIDPNDAWEVIEGEETSTYNYFIDDEEEPQEPAAMPGH